MAGGAPQGSGARARSLRCWRSAAAVAGTVYLAWNIIWLARGDVPPALFKAITGWPAPTTGGTRALLALAAGDWQRSIVLNPLAVPMTALFLVTLAWPLACWWRKGRPRLPRELVWVWLTTLGLAWLAKAAVALGGPGVGSVAP